MFNYVTTEIRTISRKVFKISSILRGKVQSKLLTKRKFEPREKREKKLDMSSMLQISSLFSMSN